MPVEIFGIKYYPITELDEVLGISEITLRRYIKDGKIKGLKHKNKWLISEKNIQDYLQSISIPGKRNEN